MKNFSTIKLILADDDEFFRDGFRGLIEQEPTIDLVAEAPDGYSLLNLVDINKPDVVIVDIRMPGLNGIQATTQLNAKYPGLAIIALSMFNDDYLIVDMLTAGANGYLLKGSGRKTIIEAINTVYKNQNYYCPGTSISVSRLIATKVYDPVRRERITVLTPREKEVLYRICCEKNTEEIAKELCISPRTVEGCKSKIWAKANTKNLIGLYHFAVNQGIIPGNFNAP